MPDRIAAFLNAAGWSDAQVQLIAGDMSSRRYARLSLGDQTAILMDADSNMTPFAEMTAWLSDLDLTVPRILADVAKDGLLLLEDLGDISLKAAMRQDPSLKPPAYAHCLDILLRLQNAAPPNLTCPTAYDLVTWTELADDHIPGVNAAGLARFRSVLLPILEDVLSTTPTVSLRDFHSENIMWLPEREGINRLGILDYQDAFLTNPLYDLVSLLTDARNWVPKSERQSVSRAYLDRTGENEKAFNLAFASLSAQRNLRILGIFARAGKPIDLMQVTCRYFAEALEHPAFAAIRDETLRALPAELAS